MRIAFDAKRAFNNFTGLGNYSRILIEALENFFPEHEYFLFTPGLREELIDAFSFYSPIILPQKKIYRIFPFLWRSWSIAEDLHKLKIDVFHGLSNEVPFSVRSVRAKIIVTIHDLLYLKYPNDFPLTDRMMFDLKTRFACKHADFVIVNSYQTQKDLINLLRVPDKKIMRIPLAISNLFIKPIDETRLVQVKKSYALPDFFLLQPGTFLKRKNHLLTLQAIKMLQNEMPELCLVLTGGGGNYRNEVMNAIKKLGLTKKVMLLRNISVEDMVSIYKMASAVVYPSLGEGFGLPILEAFASGVPVVVSNIEVFREIAEGAACFIDPHSVSELVSSINKILSDKGYRNTLVEKGFCKVKEYNPESLARSTQSLYGRL
ncbi:MAG: glycosyltransferase family 1 protein [Chitinophagales bacterium]|nr:glycosyltransferase family 1 protein [Chitinophagales bacterium]